MHTVLFFVILVTFFPILLWQGKHVRSKTLRLPPPKGSRRKTLNAISNEHSKLNVLVLGDSAAEGVGADLQDHALFGKLLDELSQKLNQPFLSGQLIAQTGHTITNIIYQLNDYIEQEKVLLNVDIVVISAGVNDVTTLTKLSHWKQRTNLLIHLLQTKLNAKHIIFTAVPPMQYFPALPFPISTWLGLRASALNQALQKICHDMNDNNNQCIDFLKLDLDFDPNYMAKDGFHPSEATYQAWAEACVDLYMVKRACLAN